MIINYILITLLVINIIVNILAYIGKKNKKKIYLVRVGNDHYPLRDDDLDGYEKLFGTLVGNDKLIITNHTVDIEVIE